MRRLLRLLCVRIILSEWCSHPVHYRLHIKKPGTGGATALFVLPVWLSKVLRPMVYLACVLMRHVASPGELKIRRTTSKIKELT